MNEHTRGAPHTALDAEVFDFEEYDPDGFDADFVTCPHCGQLIRLKDD